MNLALGHYLSKVLISLNTICFYGPCGVKCIILIISFFILINEKLSKIKFICILQSKVQDQLLSKHNIIQHKQKDNRIVVLLIFTKAKGKSDIVSSLIIIENCPGFSWETPCKLESQINICSCCKLQLEAVVISGQGVGVNKMEAFLIVELSDISNLIIKQNILNVTYFHFQIAIYLVK